MGVLIGEGIYTVHTVICGWPDIICLRHEDMEFGIRLLLEYYEKWSLKINVEYKFTWVVEQKQKKKIKLEQQNNGRSERMH